MRPRQRGVEVQVREIDAVRAELRRRLPAPRRRTARPARSEDVQRSVARLVLTLVEFLRQLMERQAIRRMESGTLTASEIEALGRALMELERTIRNLAARFGLAPEDLNLDLGPTRLL